MQTKTSTRRITPELAWVGLIVSGCAAIVATTVGFGREPAVTSAVADMAVPATLQPAGAGGTDANDRASESLAWRLNNPAPNVVPASKANPGAVADKSSARARSMDARAMLRAFEGAPPVIPHSIAGLNIQTCRACHAQGLQAGDKVARMVSHTYLTSCTQCHVESAGTFLEANTVCANSFVGLRPSGYGGTRAGAGAPPVMPHTTFMRTNCVSCHGEHGYDGWRPDHLSRTNCVQCHAPAAEFDQLAPTFGIPDLADGESAASHR